MTRNIYLLAWRSLKAKIATKTTWGRNELERLMAEAMEEAVETVDLREVEGR